ncbi:ABC transporter substrate-binding protein [Ruania albidiflava]|uniref:ABC transporter substrate-binding protein n=1 Tax=Ruania albidiflava TaxID=366586 RepID=UPI0003B5FB3F|nr:ABC transporter substrate-binding protein [Ruania albidiflava]
MVNVRRNRTLISVATITTLGLALAGCSGGAGGSGGEATSAGGGSSPTSEDFSGVTLDVSASWSGAEQKNFEAVLDKFAQDTGATVNYTSFGDNASTILGTQIEGGNPPDVALLPQPALLQQFASSGDIVPLSDAAQSEVAQNYGQSWIDLATVDGKEYGVWFKASNKSTVWYNKDIYDQAGATVPKTWDEFMQQLQLIQDSGYSGISIGADVGWPITDWFENVYLRTAGAQKYDELTQHKIPWTDPSVTKALQVLAQLFSSDVVEPGAAQRTFPESVTEMFGADPNAGTVYEGDFVAGNITDDGNSTVGQNALFYDFPSIDGSAPAVVGGGDVAVAFNDDPATDALMQYLASPQAAEIWIPNGGLTSPNQAVDTSVYPDDTSRQIAEALVNAETFRFDMSDLTPSAFGGTEGQGEWQIMIQFLEDPSDIQGTQQALEDAAQAAYK